MSEGLRSLDADTIVATDVLDGSRFSILQWRVVLLCGFVAVLDGMDLQSMGLAAPSMTVALNIDRQAIGFVFSAALLGLMLGSAVLGPLADRVGRRGILILSTLAFGAFTILTAFAQDLTSLLVIRLLAGIGLGGATPSFVSLTAEYAPPRLRRLVVTLLWAGIPLGGALGGVLAAQVIPTLGWRMVFFIAGGLPIALSAMLFFFLPESLNFLVRSKAGADRIFGILTRIAPDHLRHRHYVLAESTHVDTPVKQLFTERRLFGTVLLWGLFFLIFSVLVTNTAWSPTLLTMSGLSSGEIGWIMAASNAGAVMGAIVIGVLIQLGGPYRVLTTALVVGGLCFTLFGLALPSFGYVSLLQGVVQLLVGGSGAGAVAVAAMFYPTSARSTGVGWATGFGRLGSFVGPLAVGSLMTAHFTVGAVYAALGVLVVFAGFFMLIMGREQHRRGITSQVVAG